MLFETDSMGLQKMSQPKAELDTPWKTILDIYFKEFILYCWPEKYAEIDWSRGYKTLDKELSKIARNAPIGNRVADKLIEVYRKDGQETYILIHIEIQGYLESDFEERMYVYRYRLRDLHRKPIASLAILVDTDEKWRPNCYKEELWGSSVEMRFPIIKILDYRNRIHELEEANNPFAQVILAQLAALEKQLPEAKLISKINLIKRLYQRGWQKDDIITLLIFIDWVMALPPTLELEFRDAVRVIEEDLHVNYVTSFERIGIQKGESILLMRILERKFKNLPEQYRQKVEQASPDSLLKWGEKILESQELEEIFE